MKWLIARAERLANGITTSLFMLGILTPTLLAFGISGVAHASGDPNTYPWSYSSVFCSINGGGINNEGKPTPVSCYDGDYGLTSCPSGDGYCSDTLNNYYQEDNYGYQFANCTSYVAQKVYQVYGQNIHGWGNASSWNTKALQAGYTDDPTNAPQVGDIGVWVNADNGVGHVAYVASVTNGVATFDEYNVANTGAYTNSYTSSDHPGDNGQTTPDYYIHTAPSGGGGSSGAPRVAAIQYNTEMDIFKRGSGNSIWQDTIQSGSNNWGGWHNLGGILASNPTADQYGAEMDVFATNSAGVLYQNTYQPSTNSWGGWTQRGSGMAGDPTSIVYNGWLYIFSRGTDGNLYMDYWNGNTWSGFQRLAGNGSTQMGSSPTATVYGSELDVYMRGVDSNLWKTGTENGTTWGSLGNMGGGDLENNPSAVTFGSEMDVYVNTTNGTLVHDTWNGSSWSGFTPLTGASFQGSPDAITYGNNEMDVFDRGISDSYIYENKWDTGNINWSGWTNLGGNEATDPTALQWGTEIDLYDTNYANNTDHDTWLSGTGTWGGFSALL